MPLLLHFHDLMRERRIPFAEARIHMVVPEIPMTEGDEILKIGEQMVFGVQPLSADQTPRGEVCIRPFAAGVRDDIVHAVVMPFEVVQSLVQLIKGGRLLPPPALPLDAEGAVDARRLAKGEEGLAPRSYTPARASGE